ncbi:MAG: hypothetical protein R3C05_09320 [Pirellulaceae bacterium]
MRDLIDVGMARLAGQSSEAIFHLKQAMGGGKTHLLVGFWIVGDQSRTSEDLLQRVIGRRYIYASANVAAFNGRNNPDHFFWGEIAQQLGKTETFNKYWANGPKAPTEGMVGATRGRRSCFDPARRDAALLPVLRHRVLKRHRGGHYHPCVRQLATATGKRRTFASSFPTLMQRTTRVAS